VVRGDDVVLAESFGYADIAAKKAYTTETKHRIGSVTKTMLSLAVMSLVDEGRLSLDDRIADLLPDLRLNGYGDTLALRHLLTHTGGIGEAPTLEDLSQPFDKLFAESDPNATLTELYPNGVTIEVPPGTKWAYANHGFALLGEILARTEGEPLPAVLEKRVFGPLGMTSTDFIDEPRPELARGYSQAPTPEALSLLGVLGIEMESYEPEDGHNLPGKYTRIWGNGGAGAAHSTVSDMARYASALLRGSRGVVRPETLAKMSRDQWRPDARFTGWGLGFHVRETAGHRSFGHGGAVFGGWNTALEVFPDLDAALVFHTNLWSDWFDTVVVPRILEAFLGAEPPDLTPRPIDERILESAPGAYELPGATPLTDFRARFTPGRVRITREEDALLIHGQRGPWKDGARLVPADVSEPDLFFVHAAGYPPSKLVLLMEGGAVTGLRAPNFIEMRKKSEE
jgi:CubicO group peptidase (beta-lactamase class C family)